MPVLPEEDQRGGIGFASVSSHCFRMLSTIVAFDLLPFAILDIQLFGKSLRSCGCPFVRKSSITSRAVDIRPAALIRGASRKATWWAEGTSPSSKPATRSRERSP